MKRKILLLIILVAVILIAIPIVIFILHDTPDDGFIGVQIGNQEITEQEISIMRNLNDDDEFGELLMSMHMYSEIRNMLLFRWAEERGIAPSNTETRTFIEDYARALMPDQHFELMGISEEEYWDGFGFRNAQNLLTADRILEYLNMNDATTTYSIEQYQNYRELGSELMRIWKMDSPELVIQFGLDDAAEIFR